MIEGASHTTVTRRSGTSFARRRILDAIVVDGRDAWPLLAHEIEDLIDLLDLEADPAPLRLCRGVRADGTVLLGSADPDRDPLLSYVVGGMDGGST